MNLLKKPQQSIPIRKKERIKNLLPSPTRPNPIVGRPVTQPASNPVQQASTGLSIASQNRPKPLSTPHQGMMGAMGAMQSAKPPQAPNSQANASSLMAQLNQARGNVDLGAQPIGTAPLKPPTRSLMPNKPFNPIIGGPVLSPMSNPTSQDPTISTMELKNDAPPSVRSNMPYTGQPVSRTNYATTAASKTPIGGTAIAPPTATATATAPPKAPAPVAKPNANVQAALNAMTPAMRKEIERKAKAGIPMENTTEAKRWLYDSFKKQVSTPTKPGPPSTAKPPVTGPVAPVTEVAPKPYVPTTAAPTDNGQVNWNSNQSIPDFGSMTPEMIQQLIAGYANGGQQYDPATDPAYQAQLSLANKQADAAGLSTMEDMNERGILNSTVTSDRVGQIKQGASDAVIGNIPGMQANFQNQQANNLNGLQNLLQTVMGGAEFQQTFAEGNRRYDKDFSLDEAQTTGSYMPAEAKGIVDRVMNAKKANTQPGLSAAERAKNAEIANTGRQQLAAMGIDVSGINGDVTYDNAIKNLPNLGRSTIIQQQTDLDKTEVMGKQVDTKAQALIQTVLRAKGDNEKGIGNKAANARIADDARAQLSALGFDVSGIGGSVKYDQAVKNASNMGKNTLGRDGLNNDARQANADRALNRDKLNADTAIANRDLNFQEQNAMIVNDLTSRGLDLESVRNDIDWFNAETDAEYKQRVDTSGISEQAASTNTNKALGNIAGASSASEAWAYVSSNTDAWAASGVDVKAVYDAIEQRFPGSTDAVKGKKTDTSMNDLFGTP